MCQHENKEYGLWTIAKDYRWREFKCLDCGVVGGHGRWEHEDWDTALDASSLNQSKD